MKSSFLIVLLLLAQPLPGQIAQEYRFTDVTLSAPFSEFIVGLKKLNRNSEVSFLKTLSARAHHLFLRKYVAYSHVENIFKSGNYDCLSGTYFFCATLDQFGFRYRIIETNYHIFLLVQTARGDVLLESTDRANGVINDEKTVGDKLEAYRTRSGVSISSALYLSDVLLFHELEPEQLPGLLYFNLAVEAYNKKDFFACGGYLEKAWKIYDNPRIERFIPILIHSIHTTASMDRSQKERLMMLLKSYPTKSMPTLAAN